MSLTPSAMLPIGTAAPDFSLPNIDGKTVSLKDFKNAKGLVVVFMCNHCPYVVHIQKELARFGKEMLAKGIAMVGINSNDAKNYPEDSPKMMVQTARELNYTFPYLFDETQNVAKAYQAACTPDFFLFDKNLRLVYRGQFDESRPGNNKPVTGKDLREAVENLLAGEPISPDQKPSVGCSIKWKQGNEPQY